MGYEELAKKSREEVTKITKDTMRKINKVYGDVVRDIGKDIKKGSLNERWAKDYQKELESYREYLAKEIGAVVTDGVNNSVKEGIKCGQLELEIKPSFSGMFSKVQNEVLEDIISGNLYKDKKSLSSRIWSFTRKNQEDLQYVITKGIAQKKSAMELAKDLEIYVKSASKRPTSWGRVYPNLKAKEVDYNAMRLARTTLNHGYQTATIKSSALNPFVTGIRWESAAIHGRTCQECMDRDGKIYPLDQVPLDHPNGLCTMIPEVPSSLDEIAEELSDWLSGGENEKLDKWYEEMKGVNVDRHVVNRSDTGYNNIKLIKSNNPNRHLYSKVKAEDFNELAKDFINRGGEIITNESAVKYLDFRLADGVCFNDNLIFLRPDYSYTELMEELEHSEQYFKGLINSSNTNEMEVLAKINVLKKVGKYDIPEIEKSDLEKNLKEYIKLVERDKK